MASQRLLLLVLLATISVAVALSVKSPKDVTIGARQPGDHLAKREFVTKESQWLQVVTVQQTIGVDYGKITQVKLLDQNQKGNGATAAVLAGGPGDSYVTVKFKSVRSHSIKYIVEIYAR